MLSESVRWEQPLVKVSLLASRERASFQVTSPLCQGACWTKEGQRGSGFLPSLKEVPMCQEAMFSPIARLFKRQTATV